MAIIKRSWLALRRGGYEWLRFTYRVTYSCGARTGDSIPTRLGVWKAPAWGAQWFGMTHPHYTQEDKKGKPLLQQVRRWVAVAKCALPALLPYTY